MKTTIPTVKGARDFYPEQKALHSWMGELLRSVSHSFGYQEYDGPFLEKIDLYAAKSSEELVKEQSFVFPDRGGELIALRPELTPSLARMVAQRQGELVFPMRWWSFGPFWRYERPQKGRSREFYQWNIDLIGVDTPEADAELVAVAATFFKKIGLGPDLVKLYVNNRKLMNSQLEKLGIPVDLHPGVFHLIDRRDKMQPDDWDAYSLEIGLKPEELEGLKRVLANPELWKEHPDFERFFNVIDAMGLRDYVVYDPGVIRGLDYYTGMVFEAFEKDGGRAILGGGHYDNLVAAVGGDHLPGVGFAMGDAMIMVVLEKYGCLPQMPVLDDAVLVTVFEESLIPASYAFTSVLHEAGVRAVCYPDAAKLQKQLKFADRMRVRYAVIMGPDEAAAGQVTVKNLAERTQETMSQADAAVYLREQLNR